MGRQGKWDPLILEDNQILVYILAKYVDNINIATSLIPDGTAQEKVAFPIKDVPS